MTNHLLARLKYGSAPWSLYEADLLGADLSHAQYSPDDLIGALHVPQAKPR